MQKALPTTILLLLGFVHGQQQAASDQCNNGFTDSFRLLDGHQARNGYQYIFPRIAFTCHGSITLWRFYARYFSGSSNNAYPEFQVWRPYNASGSVYTKVAQTSIRSNSNLIGPFTDQVDELYTYNTSTSDSGPMAFQPGDIVGLHTPRTVDGYPKSRLRPRFNPGQQSTGGTLSYRQLTEESLPLSVFDLTGLPERYVDIPLISIQVVISNPQETESIGVSTAVLTTEKTLTLAIVPSYTETETPSASTGLGRSTTHERRSSVSTSTVTKPSTTMLSNSRFFHTESTDDPPFGKSQPQIPLALTIGVAAGVGLTVVLAIIILIVIFCSIVCLRKKSMESKNLQKETRDPALFFDANQAYGIHTKMSHEHSHTEIKSPSQVSAPWVPDSSPDNDNTIASHLQSEHVYEEIPRPENQDLGNMSDSEMSYNYSYNYRY